MATYCAVQLTAPDGSAYTIVSFPALVGKTRDAGVQISGNPSISRYHARILHDDNMFAVEDLGSTNKTYVQGYEVKPGAPTILSDGDIICFADSAFRVHLIAYDSQTSTLLRETAPIGGIGKSFFR